MDNVINFGATAEERDIGNHFHAYTNARWHMDVGPMIIDEGSGIYVSDNGGRRYTKSVAMPGRLGTLMNAALLHNSLISRSMTDAAAFCPPMIITRAQADEMFEIVAKSLAELEAEEGV